jgi:hypothetical protein
MREVTAQLRNGVVRIDNAPPQFQVEAYFGKGGDASALLYRNCVFAADRVIAGGQEPGQAVRWHRLALGEIR